MVSDERPEVVICCGGGTDSTALLPYYLDQGLEVRGVHFDYGQPCYPGESRAVRENLQQLKRWLMADLTSEG